jgi:hypothetical protein
MAKNSNYDEEILLQFLSAASFLIPGWRFIHSTHAVLFRAQKTSFPFVPHSRSEREGTLEAKDAYL